MVLYNELVLPVLFRKCTDIFHAHKHTSSCNMANTEAVVHAN